MAAVDTSVYERQRRGVEDQFGATQASSSFARFLSQQRGERDQNDFGRSFRRGTQGFNASFGQRGLAGGGVRSGVMQRAMSDRVGDFNRDLGRMQQDNQQQQQQFDLSDAQLQQWRQGALNDIEAEKQRAIATAALNLNALKPYLGGY